MTGRKWTSEPQEVWLKKQFPMFMQADTPQMKKKFLVDIYTAWQTKWPNPAPTNGELTAAGNDLTAAMAVKRAAKDKVSSGRFF